MNTIEAITCPHGYGEFGRDLGCPDCKAANDALDKAEQAAAHKRRWEEGQAAERAHREKHFAPVYAAILAEINNRPEHAASVILGAGRLMVDGIFVDSSLTLDFERSHQSSYRSVTTERVRVTTGHYGDRTSYPPRKDGTHNYAKIADYLIGKAALRKGQAACEATRSNNTSIAAAARKTLGLDDHIGKMTLTASAVAEKPVFVKVGIECTMTVAEATALRGALVALGYVTPKKDVDAATEA